MVNETQEISRLLESPVTPLQQFGKPPSAGVLKRINARSDTDAGPAREQASIPSSSKVEERRLVPYTVVSKIMEKNEGTRRKCSSLAA